MTVELRLDRCQMSARRQRTSRCSAAVIACLAAWPLSSSSIRATETHDQSYETGARNLTLEQRAGRDTWFFWTGGDEAFWRQLAVTTSGNVDLLLYIDSRRRDRRFQELGVINDPACARATAADKYGLWIDDCGKAEELIDIPGVSAGIIGLRRFDNPAFDAGRWDLEKYLRDRNVEPPYRVGMTCAFCHAGFNPINPPADPEHPGWSNLLPTMANQYFEEGKLVSMTLTAADFRWHVANRQPPGTSDTSLFPTDHINNWSAINSIFNLGVRPTFPERMADGSTREVNHILKDGADSIGLAGAALRVYVNIGLCSEYSTTLHDPIVGIARPQQPFDLEHARATCENFRATEARMPAAAAFLKTQAPPKLADAPGGAIYLSDDPALLRRGKLIFADECATCHSSKQPPVETLDRQPWFRDAVLADDFLADNFLSSDVRYPVTRIGTNIERTMGSNAIRGHIWDQFSSETYKSLPAAGTMSNLYNPRDPAHPISMTLPGGGRGYYRPASLAGLWATAPYLHNNSVGAFVKDPSVAGRMAAFTDGIEKMLWPERRLGLQSMPVTTTESSLAIPGTSKTLRVPAGTPIDYFARADPAALAHLAAATPGATLTLDDAGFVLLLKSNLAPDFVLDHGHTFGSSLSDDDKRALIEFLKRL